MMSIFLLVKKKIPIKTESTINRFMGFSDIEVTIHSFNDHILNAFKKNKR